MCKKAEVTNEHEALPCSENQSRLSTLMPDDIDLITITRSIITTHVVVITRLLLMIIDADHVVQIGRNIAAHDIVNARLLLIIRISKLLWMIVDAEQLVQIGRNQTRFFSTHTEEKSVNEIVVATAFNPISPISPNQP